MFKQLLTVVFIKQDYFQRRINLLSYSFWIMKDVTDPCLPFRQDRCTPVRWSWWESGRRRRRKGWVALPLLLLLPAPPRHCPQGWRLRSPRWTRCCSCSGPPPNRPTCQRSHAASWTDAPPEDEGRVDIVVTVTRVLHYISEGNRGLLTWLHLF